ncbi:MAG: hypothetical protein Q9177_000848 [Variospora cf. flavescens]
MHKDPIKESVGAIRAQNDWTRFVGPVGNYKGGLGTPYSFMGVTVPECLPERMEIISYANEFAFLYDDIMEKIDLNKAQSHLGENVDRGQGDESDRRILDVFGEGVLSQGADPNVSATGMNTASSGYKRIQSQILSEMAAIDKERALTSMKSWATFVQLAASRQRSQPFASLKEYLPYRIIDAGEM